MLYNLHKTYIHIWLKIFIYRPLIISFMLRWHKYIWITKRYTSDSTERESYTENLILYAHFHRKFIARVHIKAIPFSENTHPKYMHCIYSINNCYKYMHFDLVVCATKNWIYIPISSSYKHFARAYKSSNIIHILTNWIFHSITHTHTSCASIRTVCGTEIANSKCNIKLLPPFVVDVVIFVAHPLSFLHLAWRIWTFIITSLMNVSSSLCILVSFNYVCRSRIHISFILLLISKRI